MYATPAQAQQLLRHQVEQLASDPALAEQLPPLMLWGPPGVGKSSLVRQVAEQQGIGVIDIRLARRHPRADYLPKPCCFRRGDLNAGLTRGPVFVLSMLCCCAEH